MRHGVVREAGRRWKPSSSRPRIAYTRALIAAAPDLERRPKRLPVIDDIMNDRPWPAKNASPHRPVVRRWLQCAALRKDYSLQETGLFGRIFQAVAEADLCKGAHPGRGGRIRLGQDHHRHDADTA